MRDDGSSLWTPSFASDLGSAPSGPCGTGKSHLAQALGHCAVRQGVDVLFSTQAQLSASLTVTRVIGAFERKLATLVRVPLLIIDDFGLKPMRPPADEGVRE